MCNQSQTEPVYFDNIQVTQKHSAILEENHYYAYGLKINAISSHKIADAAEGAVGNFYLYNDKELWEDGDLNWYDYGFRNYDAQIGRFVQLDPLTSAYPYWSPYAYAGNDPINFIDYMGLGPIIPGLTEATAVTLETVIIQSRSGVQAGIKAGAKKLGFGSMLSLTGSEIVDNIGKALDNIILDIGDFIIGAGNALATNLVGGAGRSHANTRAGVIGAKTGDLLSMGIGVLEIGGGLGIGGGGAATVVIPFIGEITAPAGVLFGSALIVHGGYVTIPTAYENFVKFEPVSDAPGYRRKNRLPDRGAEPNSTSTNPSGTTTKKYNKDGKTVKEYNKAHKDKKYPKNEQEDHVHDWRVPGDKKTRMPGRKPKRNELKKDFNQ